LFFLLPACRNEPAVKAVKRPDGDYSEIIRIEEGAFDDRSDTVHVPKMHFEETVYDFGTITEGTKVRHSFPYTNAGTKPLVIRVARSTCGCTVPYFNDKTPLPPGGKDSIVVVFDSHDKMGPQNKVVTVVANSYPNKVKLYLRGTVVPAK